MAAPRSWIEKGILREICMEGYQQTDVWRDLQVLELSQDTRELP
jgi:hypothetical protein